MRARLARGGVTLRAADLRQKLFSRRQRALIVFVIDASESMGEGTLARMAAAKGAILALLTSAYQNRDRVALVAFRDRQAEVLLPPTSSALLARRHLRRLPLGGATPFADGLRRARLLIATERRRQPGLHPLLVIVSDGEANVPLVPGAAVRPELFALARQTRRDGIEALVVDSRLDPTGSDTLRTLAVHLGGRYRHLRELHAGSLLGILPQEPGGD